MLKEHHLERDRPGPIMAVLRTDLALRLGRCLDDVGQRGEPVADALKRIPLSQLRSAALDWEGGRRVGPGPHGVPPSHGTRPGVAGAGSDDVAGIGSSR